MYFQMWHMRDTRLIEFVEDKKNNFETIIYLFRIHYSRTRNSQ